MSKYFLVTIQNGIAVPSFSDPVCKENQIRDIATGQLKNKNYCVVTPGGHVLETLENY